MAIHESFVREIWDVAAFCMAKASNLRKFSQRKPYFSQIRESFPLYGILSRIGSSLGDYSSMHGRVSHNLLLNNHTARLGKAHMAN